MWLLDGLWRALGVDRALAGVLGARRFTTDVERVLFALVCNRALDPCSKLAAAEWASHDVHIPGLAAMDEDQAYRAMDLLIDADAEALMERRLSREESTGCPRLGRASGRLKGAAGLADARRAVRLLYAGARVGYRLRKTGFRRESPAV